MFFLPAAVFAGVLDPGWDDALLDWLPAGSGDLVGAAVLVARSYWYLFLEDAPDRAPATEEEPAERA